MQLKGPFKLTGQNLYFVPSKPGVYVLGNQEGNVVYVGKSDRDLSDRLKDHLKTAHAGATQFWYWDTWNTQEAAELSESLTKKYEPSGNKVAH
jgi:excinuclease UvrABC nuclease subunit